MHRTLAHHDPDQRAHPPSNDDDGVSLAWFESMASLAWLLERRMAALAEGGGRAYLACLRLRAIVALMWWERMLPQALSCWSFSDAERLVAAAADVDADSGAIAGRQEQGLMLLTLRGPTRAVLDWVEAAGIRGGPVFRRIKPNGQVRMGALTPVGIASLFSSLLMEGRRMGVIDRQFSLDFSKRSPACSGVKPSYRPIGRDELRQEEGCLEVSGGGALVSPTAWGEPTVVDLEDALNVGDHACP